MNAAPWGIAEVVLLRQMVQGGKDSREICEEFNRAGIGRSQKAVSRKIAEERRKEPGGWRVRVATSPFAKLPGPLTIEGDCLVCSDIHAPFHDADFLNAVIDLALKYGIRKTVVAGDVLEFAAFSHYGRTRYVEAEQELDACKQVMDSLANAFDDVVLIMGNHEQRFSRFVGSALDAEQLLAKWIANPKVRTSRLHWCDVISGGRKWRVEHPTSTSVNAGVVPAKLCAKHHCSVIGAHGHVWGQTKDVSGDYYAIDLGVIVDPDRLEYGYIAHSTRPAQMQGACLLVGGTPILLAPENIAWYEGMRRG